MDTRVRSGLYFRGSSMRYAEIQHTRTERKLLRLGSCDFEFDAEAAMFGTSTDGVATIREALADVFSGTRSKHFSIVVPPSSAVAFYSPISASLADGERLEHIEREARLVSGSHPSVAVTAEAVGGETYEDEDVTWHHVVAMPKPSWDHLTHVLSVFEGARYRYVTRLQSAALVAAGQAMPNVGDGRGLTALVGRFGEVTEIGLVSGGNLRSSQVSELTEPTDVCYQLLSLLNGSDTGRNAVRAVFTYGERDADLESNIKSLVSSSVSALDALSNISNRPDGAAFDPGQYLLCMGAAS